MCKQDAYCLYKNLFFHSHSFTLELISGKNINMHVNIYATHFLNIFMFPHFCSFKFECYRNRHSYNI